MEKTTESIEIWVVRHGQTFDNIKAYCQGHLPGKLTETGIEQAKLLGKRLAATEFQKFYVSDLGRTKETFEQICSQRKDKPSEESSVVFSSLMREKGGGEFEGGPLAILNEAQKKSGLGLRDFKPKKGESWIDVYERAAEQFRRIYFDCLASGEKPGNHISLSVSVSPGYSWRMDHGTPQLHQV